MASVVGSVWIFVISYSDPSFVNTARTFWYLCVLYHFSLYLSYADIGFLSSGQKFAGEECAKGNQVEEVGIAGFSLFLLLLLFLPFSMTGNWQNDVFDGGVVEYDI